MECKACTWRKCLGRGRPHHNGWNKPPTGCCAMHKQGATDDKCSHPFHPSNVFLNYRLTSYTQLWKAFNTLKVSLCDIFGEKVDPNLIGSHFMWDCLTCRTSWVCSCCKYDGTHPSRQIDIINLLYFSLKEKRW